jgi:outer membrane receptor for ferrienterochelin and colicins
MKISIKNIIWIFLLSGSAYAQMLHGTIKEFDDHKKLVPLPGASVRWSGTTYGAITDTSGTFNLNKITAGENKLIVSFIGYKTDTIEIAADQTEIKIVLTSSSELKELVITGELEGSYFSKMKPLNTTVITGAGLQKAACCNLSESFQNSATVDVNYSDAVTGAKQIQMLGLAGIYSQIQVENVPAVRGLATTFGLGYIPGPWMESIQISKGTSSVINGFESITGQINVQYKEPSESKEKLYVNAFGNNMGRYELNLNTKAKINDRLSTMFFIHGEDQSKNIDMNNDMFLDQPLVSQINFMNRWTYQVPGKFISKTVFSVLNENRTTGQMDAPKNADYGDTSQYSINVATRRYQFFTKNGFMFKDQPYKSIGTIISGTHHEQNSFFGLNKYDATENSIYANFLYATIIGNTNNKITSGFSFVLDDDKQKFNDTTMNKLEYTPGAFAEYTYDHAEIYTFIAGLRADYNNKYGLFITPRVHFRYNINEKLTLRASAGKGSRTANVLPENSAILASSRKLVFLEDLKPEQAWNYGISFVRSSKIAKRDATFSIDFFRTDFINQVIADVDRNPSYVYFYNLNGKSYSNSAQAEFTFQPVKRFSVTTAFRYNDVKMTIDNTLLERPFVSNYKGVVALSYATNLKKWQFDFTANFNGVSRLPNTSNNPVQYQRPSKSPAYTLLYAQITKRYKSWDFYIGSENLTNFTQKNPIISAENPFGKYFDTSIIWGPLTGRMIYAGIRYNLKDI